MRVGDVAEDFALKDHKGEEFKLSLFKGKRVLLSFHPLAWTSVCARQMQSLEDKRDDFRKFNTVAVGLSVDSVPSKKAWAESLGISDTRLLADFWPHGHVARSFGLFREKDGFSERANVVLDESGRVVFLKVYEIKVLPDLTEILDFVKSTGRR